MAIDKAIDSTILDGYFDDIADAIRTKTGGSDTYTPAQMAQAIEDIPAGMDENLEALMAGTATGNVTVEGINNMNYTRISCGGSGSMNAITELHMPDLELFSPSSNNGEYGGLVDSTSNGTAALTVLDLPKCTFLFIHNYRYNANYNVFVNLTTLNAPKLQNIIGSMRGIGLTQLVLPEAISIPPCRDAKMTYVRCGDMPAISANTFMGCNKLVTADFCNSQSLSSNAIVGGGAFKNCSLLTAFIMRYARSAATLSGADAFTGTPIAAGTGYIYVPRALISTYQAATNWTTYANQFRAIEDYTDDGTIDGEFVPPAN